MTTLPPPTTPVPDHEVPGAVIDAVLQLSNAVHAALQWTQITEKLERVAIAREELADAEAEADRFLDKFRMMHHDLLRMAAMCEPPKPVQPAQDKQDNAPVSMTPEGDVVPLSTAAEDKPEDNADRPNSVRLQTTPWAKWAKRVKALDAAGQVMRPADLPPIFHQWHEDGLTPAQARQRWERNNPPEEEHPATAA